MHVSEGNAMELSIGQTDTFAEFNSGAPIENFIEDFFREVAKLIKVKFFQFIKQNLLY